MSNTTLKKASYETVVGSIRALMEANPEVAEQIIRETIEKKSEYYEQLSNKYDLIIKEQEKATTREEFASIENRLFYNRKEAIETSEILSFLNFCLESLKERKHSL